MNAMNAINEEEDEESRRKMNAAGGTARNSSLLACFSALVTVPDKDKQQITNHGESHI